VLFDPALALDRVCHALRVAGGAQTCHVTVFVPEHRQGRECGGLAQAVGALPVQRGLQFWAAGQVVLAVFGPDPRPQVQGVGLVQACGALGQLQQLRTLYREVGVDFKLAAQTGDQSRQVGLDMLTGQQHIAGAPAGLGQFAPQAVGGFGANSHHVQGVVGCAQGVQQRLDRPDGAGGDQFHAGMADDLLVFVANGQGGQQGGRRLLTFQYRAGVANQCTGAAQIGFGADLQARQFVQALRPAAAV
jgi:hypothetical protein